MTREEAIKELSGYEGVFIPPSRGRDEAITMAIEALKAERHGEWEDVNGDETAWRCKRCKEISCCNDNFCPNCGAKMDKD